MSDAFSYGDETRPGIPGSLLFNLVYCSRATAGVTDADIQRILVSARHRNPMLGITGVLVFGGGIFFQWLEGPQENVRRLMSMLLADPRHENIVELSTTEEVRERLFPAWDMELATTDTIRDVLLDAHGSAETAPQVQALERLLAQLDAGELGTA